MKSKNQFKIMVWSEKRGGGIAAGGWFYLHDKESGDPYEYDTLEEATTGIEDSITKGYPMENLKIIREYPFKAKIKVRVEAFDE